MEINCLAKDDLCKGKMGKKKGEKQPREKKVSSPSMSRNYMLPESSVVLEKQKLPRGPTNSYKCQIGFSDVLCEQLFLLDSLASLNIINHITSQGLSIAEGTTYSFMTATFLLQTNNSSSC